MNTALVHDWWIAQGGAERVLEAIYALYPAPVYTLLCDKKKAPPFASIHTSFLQHLPFSLSFYRSLLPLFPLALKRFDLSRYDLILSSSFLAAKGIVKQPHQLHICYCHTPMRIVWDKGESYRAQLNWVQRCGASLILPALARWDLASTVDHFVANSFFVAKRIQKIYGREATVIYPPVRTEFFNPNLKRKAFYLTVSRLVSYKKVDLIVKAFNQMPDKHLIVVGNGPEMKRIKALAHSNIQLLGWQPDTTVRTLMEQTKGFIFAAEEDFGITPVEAQAAGAPVIAYGAGGALETVIPNITGLFFEAQTEASLQDTLSLFEKNHSLFDPLVMSYHANQFNTARFNREFKHFVEQTYESHRISRRTRP